MTIKERNWLSPMGLVKQLYRPVEEMSLLPGWLLKRTERSSGPVNWGLFGENKKVGSILYSHTSEGNES